MSTDHTDPVQPNQQGSPLRVLLVTPRTARHHVQGLAACLRAKGHPVSSETLQSTDRARVPDHQLKQHDILIHAESDTRLVGELVERSRSRGLSTALVMDGVLEFANTFLNPRVSTNFLRPAPADTVLALGEHDRRILAALGNNTIATGLPRIDAFRSECATVPSHEPRALLVATANQPWFDDDSRNRLLVSLEDIRNESIRRNLPVRWRVSEEVARSLKVERDIIPLADSLASAAAVLTSASTLAIESMLSGRATAIFHPHPWPLWIPIAAIYRGRASARTGEYRIQAEMQPANDAAMRSIAEAVDADDVHDTHDLSALLDSILAPDSRFPWLQERILERTVMTDSTDRIASCISKQHQARIPTIETAQAVEPVKYEKYARALKQLRDSGSSRVALVTNAIPTPELVTIACEHGDNFIGFVMPGSDVDGEYFLGRPACGHRQVQGRFQPDALLVTSSDAMTHALAGVLWNCPIGADRVCCPDDPELPFIVADSLLLIRARLQQGEVRTTLPTGICDGLCASTPHLVLGGDPPSMILLEGTEDDFAIYARSYSLRSQGTLIRSLRWHEQELASPERYSELLDGLQGKRFGIYGAGLHTHRLLTHASSPRTPELIIDDHAISGQQFEGIPVVSPNDPQIIGLDAIVISSRLYEDRLWTRAERFRDAGIETIRLYNTATQMHDRLC